ncbi:polysaccharide deacetylase family protein [Candidatus Saccharibacteria bacterium]|nr:polysaccharide deacetylase family protein [Candidatus Saccharibacteria bacterium]
MRKIAGLLMTAVATIASVITSTGVAQAENCPIALTYDDGPSAYTNQIVDAFAAHGSRATFFMVGNMAQNFPGAAANVVAHGNQVGNHSVGHGMLTSMGPQGAAADIQQAQQMIAGATGVVPAIMRPPYGETNAAIVAAVGMPEIMWSYDSMDYATHNTESTYANVTANAQCGGIVLMHDIHASTAAAAWRILDNLQSRGFRMVTVGELIGTPPPGMYYRQ